MLMNALIPYINKKGHPMHRITLSLGMQGIEKGSLPTTSSHNQSGPRFEKVLILHIVS